jgi:hypothetical protein
MNNDSVIEILELHPNEMELIRRLRTSLKFGEMTITMRDGLPVKITRIVEIENLNTIDTSPKIMSNPKKCFTNGLN